MRTLRRALLAAATLVLAGSPAVAQGYAPDQESIGGGSDIPAGSLVELTSGATLAASHYVFADNPGTEPIEVEFRGEAPAGIEIVPDVEAATIKPGTSVKSSFSISLDPALPPGDYPVTVQLFRSDIVAQPGEVTNIPAVGSTFTIRVVGASGVLSVEARGLQSGLPVVGTLAIAAMTSTGGAFEVARDDASELTATVAPGRYRATYVLDGRELAFKEADVADGQTVTVRLEVNSVSFVIVDATPVKDGDKVVVAELLASVDNHLRTIEGDVTIHADVYRDDQQIDTAIIEQTAQLSIGVTEAKLTYRPDTGFPAGDYRFQFELVTDDFTLTSPDQPSFTVKEGSSTDGTDATMVLALVGGAAGLAAVAGGSWVLIRRNRLGRR